MDHWLALSLPIHGDLVKDASGYLASGIVLCAFSVRSMRQLRMLGIVSNISFIVYGIAAAAPPILILHSLLLPMNIYRLIQIERDTARWLGRGAPRFGRAHHAAKGRTALSRFFSPNRAISTNVSAPARTARWPTRARF